RSSGPSPVGMPPVPTAASGQTAVPPPAAGRATPPAVTGQTVVGPPPEPPAELFEDDSASISKTSGVIMMEEDEAAQTLIRGEIPAEEPVRSSPKVVIDPSASGLMERVYDDEDEPTAVESEPDELDAEDLVEEEPEPEPPAVTEAGPPPAPAASSGPPPAPEAPPRAAPPPVPASLDTGPPPPPGATASIDAAVASIAAAPATDEGWQVDAFGEHYAALLSPNRAVSASADVDFMLHCMGLARGATVLDVGCGDGAHAVAMATRGMAVTGLDPAPAQLMRASQAAASAGVAVNLVNGDMRQMPGGGPFDAVICVGGTLGLYSDEEDRRAVTEMRDRLAPGGRLMLHVLNRDYIVGRLPARSWWQGQGCLVLDEAQLYAPRSIVHVHRTVVFETGTQFEHNMGLRVYGLTELVYLCAQVGLTVLEYSGSRHTRGRFYGATSSEIWLLAQRTD
nr:methyltransferase domain-containing protein [Deltaproteobacteria bacterium]